MKNFREAMHAAVANGWKIRRQAWPVSAVLVVERAGIDAQERIHAAVCLEMVPRPREGAPDQLVDADGNPARVAFPYYLSFTDLAAQDWDVVIPRQGEGGEDPSA